MTVNDPTHVARLCTDALRLLDRCYEEGDLPDDLSVDVGTLLLRISNSTNLALPTSTVACTLCRYSVSADTEVGAVHWFLAHLQAHHPEAVRGDR